MRLLQSWVTTPLAQALGWTLLHSLWEGAIVSAVLGMALWATRSARARYAAACVALLAMLGGIGFTLVCVMPARVFGLTGVRMTARPPWTIAPDMGADGPSGSHLALLVPWLAPIWIAGVWIFALAQVGGWIWVSRLRRRGVCCAPERWQKEIERLGARLRVSKPVQLLESCRAEVPLVVGHIRPAILMPIGLLAGLPPGQIEAILLHELAHIRRHDYLVNVLQRAAECLLFYHPAAWWISHVIRTERENCCDDVAVAASGSAREYAVALAALEESRRPDWQAAVASTGGSLVKRMRRLLYPKGANGVWTPLFAAAIVITTAVVTLAAWPAKPPQQRPVATQGQKSRAETSSYGNWAKEEVGYILTDQERAAFKKLTTDEEREKFIEQFWERRNPKPGDPVNVFKNEFYRRVAYANQHFASDRPGWRTDRGFVYIVDGPPDEISMTQYGAAPRPHVPYGMQVWTYRHVDGVGDNVSVQFMDTTGKGDYEFPLGKSGLKPVLKHTGDMGDHVSLTREEAQPRAGGWSLASGDKDRGETSPYDKWLNEEVIYIVTDKERIAFQELTTDEERQKFVEQFWERRNPNPGSPENKFKEEYYRRISYTNAHFASNRPGWQTDLGRIYILFGPPDEIDSRPRRSEIGANAQDWKYGYIDGIGVNVVFTFIDYVGNGEYRLGPGKQPDSASTIRR